MKACPFGRDWLRQKLAETSRTPKGVFLFCHLNQIESLHSRYHITKGRDVLICGCPIRWWFIDPPSVAENTKAPAARRARTRRATGAFMALLQLGYDTDVQAASRSSCPLSLEKQPRQRRITLSRLHAYFARVLARYWLFRSRSVRVAARGLA